MKEEIAIITEGDFDAKVLQKILGDKKFRSKYDIQPANGFSSALSKARTILSQGNRKVIIVLDSDTVDEYEVRQKREFVDSYINPGTSTHHFKSVLAIPEFEIIFLNNKKFLSALSLTGKHLAKLGQISPKRTLESESGLKRESFLPYLRDKEIRTEFFNSSLVKEICDFIEASH